MIKLPTEKRKIWKTPDQAVWLLYGPPKIGKTTLVSQMPKPIFICTEKRQDYVEIYPIDVRSWTEITAATKTLMQTKNDFKTWCIDTIPAAWDYCIASVCKKYGVSHLFDLGKGKGWDIAKYHFRAWLGEVVDYVRAHNIGLVFIAHEKLEMATYKGEEDAMTVPYIQGSLKSALTPAVDIIGRMSFGRFTSNEGGKLRMQQGRVLICRPNTRCEAGDTTHTVGEVDQIVMEPESEIWNNIVKVYEKKKE